MQSTSQASESTSSTKEEEQHEDRHCLFCGQELTKPWQHTLPHHLAPSQKGTSHLLSPGLEESIWSLKLCLRRYSHLTFSWSVQTSVCGERPSAARSETTGLDPVSAWVWCERELPLTGCVDEATFFLRSLCLCLNSSAFLASSLMLCASWRCERLTCSVSAKKFACNNYRLTQEV